ncbi:hypothetical protein CGZ98_11820 [Enemella evansiae]|uniref:hypothetical protein n=1 Tax=Enemella evansiae TaxID=2016499 RepID=UPI000B978122|nr:hypothetical protein [Enemella evansiae]OYO09817.1 hypothetical protein CGZ98_11820 [Enemella evansiae]
MGIFASNGRLEQDFTARTDAVRATIEKVVSEQGHHLGAVSPDRERYEVTTKRTAFNWGTALALTLSENGAGTSVVIDYDNSPGSPKALMDGRKNTKAAQQFLDQLVAAS